LYLEIARDNGRRTNVAAWRRRAPSKQEIVDLAVKQGVDYDPKYL
jgi:hypothetical protein